MTKHLGKSRLTHTEPGETNPLLNKITKRGRNSHSLSFGGVVGDAALSNSQMKAVSLSCFKIFTSEFTLFYFIFLFLLFVLSWLFETSYIETIGMENNFWFLDGASTVEETPFSFSVFILVVVVHDMMIDTSQTLQRPLSNKRRIPSWN